MAKETAFRKISERIDSLRDEMIDLQIRLSSLPAIDPASGGDGEARKADLLYAFLKNNGFRNITLIKAPDLDAPDGYRPNLLGYYKGKSSTKTIWVMTHMDVVPPGDLSEWRGNPFKPWVEKGRIYGRGVEDNQQAMVSSLFAVKAFQAEGLLPEYDVGVALVADEETGNSKGIGFVLRHKNVFRKKDLIIVPDAGNAKGTMIEVAEKSILWFRIRTLGKQAHGSTPEKGINSFKAASYLVAELDKLYKLYPEKEKLFDPPLSTFEPTKKEANVPNVNTIPGEDIFYMDCRILPRYKVSDIEKSVKAAAARIERRFRVRIGVEIQQKAPAAPPTSTAAPVVLAIKRAVRSVYKKEARAMGIGGGTVAALFRRAGFSAACWSTVDETAHQPNEYCIVDNMVGDSKVFAHIFLQK